MNPDSALLAGYMREIRKEIRKGRGERGLQMGDLDPMVYGVITYLLGAMTGVVVLAMGYCLGVGC